MDILSDLLNQIDLTSSYYYRTSFGGKWGLTMPEDERKARFHIVTKGSFWFSTQENKITEVKEGDILIVFNGLQHEMRNKKNSKLLSEIEFNSQGQLTDDQVLKFGDQKSTELTNIVCGHFCFSKDKDHPFINSLPHILHIRKENNDHSSWLELILNFIDFESQNRKSGSETILKKLTEIIFIQAFRVYLESNEEKAQFLNLLQDTYVKKALDAIHSNLQKKWTLEDLAHICGMSRTSFSKHFKAVSGITPLEYLTEQRILKAKELLSTTELSTTEIAYQLGFQASEYFQKVFKKRTGITPSKYRKLA